MKKQDTRRILWVDLTKKQTTIKNLDKELATKYVGGCGLAAKILWDETTKDTQAFSSENPLIFMVGPLTGLAPSSSRYIVAGISPLTGIYGEAHGGGDWGDELRHAGFDGVVVKGRATRPVYLWIHDGEAEIRDANRFWGMDTYEVEETLRKETDEKASVACIGRAGEKMVKIACIMNDGKRGRAAARCGLGALMGFKRLKAVVVRGTGEITAFDEKRLKETIAAIYKMSPIKKAEEMTGQQVVMFKKMMEVGGAPIKNWQKGSFEAGYKLAESIGATKVTFCRHCPYSCPESHQTENGERHMVWQFWGPMGTGCLIDNADALQEAFSLCQRYGLDAISTGGVMSFGMECYEKGLITKVDTGGIELTWGNHKAMLEVVKKIGEREGIGELLGEGVKIAAERIGGIASEYAIHAKGLEFPAHDPRAHNSAAVAYATCSFGAAHCETLGHYFIEDYLTYAVEEGPIKEGVPELGYPTRLDRFETRGKGELVAKTQNLGCMVDSLGICNILFYRRVYPSRFLELLNSCTGWEMDLNDFFKTGERIYNLKRMFNVRRGISRKDDTLPARILTHKRGEGGAADNLPHLGAMLNEFYTYRGWVEEGIPSAEKITELGLHECLYLTQSLSQS